MATTAKSKADQAGNEIEVTNRKPGNDGVFESVRPPVRKTARRTTAVAGDPAAVLRERFAMEHFRDGQLAVIERLLAGKNVAAVFPTGGGKSLCYQLPALMMPGTTVVISPLIALMKDQCDALAARGIAAARLDSTLTNDEFRAAMTGIRDGSIKILYVAPERFFNERFLATVGHLDVSLFAIDEAHCISQWGHNFRPDYLKLAGLTRDLGADRVLALTATATPEVLSDIREAFAIDAADAIRTKFHRSNLHLRSVIVDDRTRDDVLIRRLRDRPRGPTLIYVTLQRTAEEVAERLRIEGLPATAYHAGMKADDRAAIQRDFLASDDGIIVATIAFGMGIDKPNIRYVYHYNPSKSLEAYAQEVGRAGRDGDDSICETLLVPDDRVVLENFTYGDTPSVESVHHLMRTISGQGDHFHVSHYRLAHDADIRPLVLRTLLTYLELDGYLRGTAPRYDTYKITPKKSSAEILANFSGEPKQFLRAVLANLSRGRKNYLLNMAETTRKLGCERERIVRAVEHLSERGWVEVTTTDLMHGYRKLKPIDSPKVLGDDYHDRLSAREASEIGRVDGVFDLIAAPRCQSAMLAAHFGETVADDCGRCSFCRGEGPHEIPPMPPRSIGSSAARMADQAAAKFPDRLVSPRDLARFLCGLSSPGFIRARITKEPGYGVCDRIPFADVRRQLSD